MFGGEVKTSEDCASADKGKATRAIAITRNLAERRP
jgi:hypothetical protein